MAVSPTLSDFFNSEEVGFFTTDEKSPVLRFTALGEVGRLAPERRRRRRGIARGSPSPGQGDWRRRERSGCGRRGPGDAG
jgi:hypothetical protein